MIYSGHRLSDVSMYVIFRKRTRAVLGRRAHEVTCWLHKGSLFYAHAGGKGMGEGALRKEVRGTGVGGCALGKGRGPRLFSPSSMMSLNGFSRGIRAVGIVP